MTQVFFRVFVTALFLSFTAGVVSVVSPTMAQESDHDHDHDDHDDHDHENETDGSLMLSATQMANLGIATVTAEIRPLQDTVELITSVEVLPERQAHVSPRFEGQIRDVRATLGDHVKTGQRLVVVEPIIAGASTLTLSAPISGVVSAQSARIGQTVAATSVLFEISDHSRMLLHGTMMESPDITRIRAGQAATVRLDALPNKPLVAEVARFYMAREAGTGLFTVHAEADNPDEMLYPGMMGTMSVAVGDAVPGLVIPRRAVLGGLGDRFVFVRFGDEFERRAVIEGLVAGADTEILEGVFPGEDVVVQGHYQLQYMGEGSAGLPTDAHAGHNH
ncbi:MAG: efflux RND transporter periplasmic adaptor subunit [Alphaproteobacteria bacterium]|nr:efflux RND transporter periplasmic adaptor subunit [Alphaproteobacteria bacterium]